VEVDWVAWSAKAENWAPSGLPWTSSLGVRQTWAASWSMGTEDTSAVERSAGPLAARLVVARS